MCWWRRANSEDSDHKEFDSKKICIGDRGLEFVEYPKSSLSSFYISLSLERGGVFFLPTIFLIGFTQKDDFTVGQDGDPEPDPGNLIISLFLLHYIGLITFFQ